MTRNNGLIIGAIIALACCNIAFGMSVQLIPLVMDAEHDSKFLIGLNTTAGQTAVTIMGFFLPALAKRFRGQVLVQLAIAVMILCLAGFALTRPLWGWFIARFISGFCISVLFTTSETWIQHAADNKSRARVMSLYMSVMTVTFGVGPFLVRFTGYQGYLPWLFGIATMLVGLAVISLLKVDERAHEQETAAFLPTLRKAPLVFVAVGATTLFEAMMLSFFTLWAIERGLDINTATSLLGFGIAACIVFFYPIGQLADHWSRRGSILLCGLAAIIASLAQPLLISSLWIWPLLVVLRAGAFGTYLNGFAMLGDVFKGPELMTAAAIVSILWGIGGMIGPPAVGVLMDHYGLWLLPWFLAACYVPVLLLVARQRPAAQAP